MAIDNSIIEICNLTKIYPLKNRGSIKDFLTRNTSLYKNLTNIKFHRKSALDNISVKINRGSNFGILGHNGSGKSTLLSIILGILVPDRGTIKVKGNRIGLLEMGSAFHPELSGKENAFLNLSILGISKNQAEEIYPKIVEFCELGDSLDYPLKTYSSGMVVRLAFSVLSHVPADIFLVDEVLAVGDYAFQVKCTNFMKKFSKNGGTIVYVSQDYNTLVDFCDQGLCLHEGKIKAIGEMKTVRDIYIEEMEKLKKI